VGRGADHSCCILLTSDKTTSIAQERLGIMAKTGDGFVIAEKDLELRGAGEILGTKQAGLPEFRIGNIVRDQQLLEAARREAEFFLTERATSTDTKLLIERAGSDSRFGLATVG
jgi:ATP-dependent DNA helicase RecG